MKKTWKEIENDIQICQNLNVFIGETSVEISTCGIGIETIPIQGMRA